MNTDKNSGILCDITGKNNLLVSFGGIMQGLGMPVFEFYNSISDVECDKIFLRDFEQSWYQKGVDKDVNSLEKLEHWLNSIIAKGNYSNVVFLGNSMGGYAAILFGVKLNITNVIAFAPQTTIKKVDRILNFDFRWRNQIQRVYKNPNKKPIYFDLNSILKKIDYKTAISIYYSPNHRLDKWHAERIQKHNKINLNPIKEGGHGVVKVLRDNGSLKKIIFSSFIYNE